MEKPLPPKWEIEAELTRRAEEHLASFIRQAWPVLEPGTTFLPNWHIDCLADHLEAVTNGEIHRLLINMPPRLGKSYDCTIFWPCWEWIRLPVTRYLFSSYSSILSVEHSLKRRNLIASDWYQERWKDRFRLSGDQNVKSEFANNHRGVMVATSVGGTAAGKGGTRVVIDDPVNPQEGHSLAILTEALNHVRLMTTRLDDRKKGAIVMVMQRVAEEDPSAWAIEQGWTHLCLPVRAPEERVILYPVSRYEKVWKEGELLCPDRIDDGEIAKLNGVEMTSQAFAGQYMQEPFSAKGEIFMREWFPIVEMPDPKDFAFFQITVDTAVSAKTSADFTVFLLSGLTRGYEVIHLDMTRGRWEPGEAVRRMGEFWMNWATRLKNKRIVVRIEDTDAAKVFRDWLRRIYPFISVVLISHGGVDKVVRARRVAPVCESNRVKLAKGPWNDVFIHEHLAFRGDMLHKHDDIVDTSSYAIATMLRINPVKPRTRIIHNPLAANKRFQ
jgi:predicted phage terminase large subunit-like protein